MPAAQAGMARHESDGTSHAKPEAQAHCDWPVSALPALYSGVVGHARQAASPAIANWPAPQVEQAASLVGVQAAEGTEPKEHVEQAEQGV